MVQKGGSSRSNRHLLPADTVEHALRGALFQYAQVAELAIHARYLHARQLRGRIALQAKILLLQCALHRLLRPHCVGGLTAKLVP